MTNCSSREILCIFPIFCPNPLDITKSSDRLIEYSMFSSVVHSLLDIENTENPSVMTKNKERGLEFKCALVAHSERPSDGYGVVCCKGYSRKFLMSKHT